MPREIAVRIRISRPAARAVVAGLILGFPCSTLYPGITQTFTLSASVPEARGQFVQLRSFGATSLGQASQNVTFVANGTSCRPAAGPPTPTQWQITPTVCPAPARKLMISGPRQLNQPVADFNDLATGVQGQTKLYVEGDVYANALCWNDGKCITEWEPEGGELLAKNQAGGNSCPPGPPIDYTNCSANQTLTSTMHLQYSISNTTGTGKSWWLYFGIATINGAGCTGACEYKLGGSNSVPWAPAPSTSKLAAKSAAATWPPPAPADTAYYHPGPAPASWGTMGPAASQVKFTCGYAYWGTNAIMDCYLSFPKAKTYNFYFDARNS